MSGSVGGFFDSIKDKVETTFEKASRRLSHHGSKGEDAARKATDSSKDVGSNAANSTENAGQSAANDAANAGKNAAQDTAGAGNNLGQSTADNVRSAGQQASNIAQQSLNNPMQPPQ
ncbi:hypothetical protein GGH12_001205 [Coemansia sp. RSA 1822]|nr:hypothetical protein LPJ76_001078 [Coemansia sp. RSA 638]KAJ2122256.1 hypothetical protein IW147_003552 [Coemansia sp. RSA 720]KAJ2483190.1 hypothetical protein IWW56_000538 [Coemansia sp. RSA 2131]KAJ2544217.1 hypothetical protein GGF49_001455 [Coemansia sp. RSA 1853]KAJ2565772.1 hypothetical protein GGH12_001205 [Coemansia sp. RSA 1822]KAJ2664068.1 hypothetical protein IW148_002126 [Coemansia sp. RSA 1199]